MIPQYLVEITAWNGSALETLYYSIGGYMTLPTDTPPNTFYAPRIKSPGLYQSAMFASGKTWGAGECAFGEIVLTNADGGLDYLLNYGFDGRSIVIKKLLATGAIIVLAACTGEQATFTTKEVSLRLRDPQAALNVAVQPVKYAGNNTLPDGVEGDSNLKGKPKPVLLGKCLNITPVMVNTSRLIYQVNDQQTDIQQVYDSGVALTREANYASTTDLQGNAPSPGCWRTDPNSGLFRLGSSPAGTVTADATTVYSPTVNNMVANLLNRAVPTLAYDYQALLDLRNLNSGQAGRYITEETTVTAVLDELSQTYGMWYGGDASGQLTFGRLDAPSGSPVADLTQAELLSLERTNTQDEGKGLPIWKVNAKYAKNYTIMNSGLAGSVTGAWESGSLGVTGNWRYMAFGNGLFVLIAGNGTAAMTSPDGITWTQRALPVSTSWHGIAYGGGQFMIISMGSNIAYTSPDCVTWTSCPLPAYASWYDVAYGNGNFVAVAYGSSRSALWNGSAWTSGTLPAMVNWSRVKYGNGIWVAIAYGSNIAAVSTDGINWTQTTMPVTANWSSVEYGNGLFVAASETCFSTSADGVNWIAYEAPESIPTPRVKFGNNMFMAVGYGGNITQTSLDGSTWIRALLPSSVNWYALEFGNGMFVAVQFNSAATALFRVTPGSLRQLQISQEYLTESVSDSSVVTAHPLAGELTLTTNYNTSASALAEATRQLNLRKVNRDYYKAEFFQGAITTPAIGQVVRVIYPRFGLSGGKLFRAIGVVSDYASGKITLGLWG